ncbi:conserved hypothetical protein [Pediculus humanus corporis]|uniref:Protein FAM91A1 n=1 Tax=Pediculus humanus subsp. corporis TaxID=121224 RepID=E0VLM3_PEDHC|nr:uncharacterized protein Phum_PHUM290370 [Pediculus humanus corporis]EEB14279.1 conserved hypothetical protein [Pediculus humanus corporis]
MNAEVENYIRNNVIWNEIPNNVKQKWILNQKEYEKQIVEFSIKNQLRFKGNIVNNVKKNAKQYYEELLAYSRQSLMLYPYHLSDVIVPGLRVTPFQYYIAMMENIMTQGRSYDSLPNFTAADCIRLLGIGRNEYIELMNKCHSGRKLFRKKNIRDLLPTKPVKINIENWWVVHLGSVTEEDIKLITPVEKELIDKIIDFGKQKAGDTDLILLQKLYNKGLVFLEVPIEDNDYIVVPPLEGFVMNRVLGDYFETLLYKIFVSIDENTSVSELANVLQIDLKSVKNAVSLYCRLGFAKKKTNELDDVENISSWSICTSIKRQSSTASVTDPLLLELDEALAEAGLSTNQESNVSEDYEGTLLSSPTRNKRIAFLFDSTLTAFLMMGNLSPGLKNHAVTMFEVGKLPDESLDSLLNELEKVSTDDSEGEAQRYFEHALVLRSTILFLRQNQQMTEIVAGVDLIRCESLQSLDAATCSRLLNKNYALLVSMAPLSKEISPIRNMTPPHLGPATPEVNSEWFKLFIYFVTGYEVIDLKHNCGFLTMVHLNQQGDLNQCNSYFKEVNNYFESNNSMVNSWIDSQVINKEESQVPSPVNGLTNQNFASILEEELNNLEKNKMESSKEKSMNERRENKIDKELSGWTLLDCDFGIPLFNATTNEQVCKAICDHKLWAKSSLDLLKESGGSLSLKLLDFIHKLQDSPDLTDLKLEETNEPLATLLPKRNLIFHDGKLNLLNRQSAFMRYLTNKLWDGSSF